MADLDAWLAERNEALRTLDLAWARKQQPKISEDALPIALHKARYECTAISDELRQQSRAWLEVRAYSRMGGIPFSADGTLPE